MGHRDSGGVAVSDGAILGRLSMGRHEGRQDQVGAGRKGRPGSTT